MQGTKVVVLAVGHGLASKRLLFQRRLRHPSPQPGRAQALAQQGELASSGQEDGWGAFEHGK